MPLKGEKEEKGGGGNLYSAGKNPLRKKKKKPSGTRSRSQSIGESKTERTSKKSVKMFSVLERKKSKSLDIEMSKLTFFILHFLDP